MAIPATIPAVSPDIQTRRLLVISYHFPPDGAVGGLRWSGLTKHLARLGWEVDVVTASKNADANPAPGVRVHVCERRRTLNDRYNEMAGRRRQASDAVGRPAQMTPVHAVPAIPPGAVRRPSILGRGVHSLRKFLGASLSYPDTARGWVTRAAGVARSLLAAKKYDLVITSGPPHSIHFAGVLATVGRQTPHWADMRDPWSHFVGDAPVNSQIKHPARSIQTMQSMVFQHVKRVIVNNDAFASALRVAEPRLPVSMIPNAVDTDFLPARTTERFDGVSIAHVGTMYAGRSLTSVLDAMSALMNAHPEAQQKFRLRLAGHMELAHRDKFFADLESHGVSNLVMLEGVLKRPEALDLLMRSHLALVLAQDQPFCVPAKLYESLGLGVTTLVITERGSASAREGERLGAIVVDPSDTAGLTKVFVDALEGRIPSVMTPRVPITYDANAAELDRLLRAELGVSAVGAAPLPVPGQ